jgi:sterol 3beta-glucosyltransferase
VERADVLVSFPYQLAGLMVHEKTGVPYVSLHFSPFGAAGGRRFAEITAPPINEARRALGLGPLRDPLGLDAISTRLALFAASSHVVRRGARWPAHYHLTGYFFLDEEPQADPDLLAFVERGERPVAVTFGSVTHERPEDVTALVLDAVGQVGCRTILQRGWSGLGRGPTPSGVFAADFIPHAWLFPRAACVVHAGGAGTTAAALRAGAPSVVVPHVLDQPIWAQIALDLGCAGAVIPFARLTATELAAALERTMRSPAVAERASLLAEKIRAEDGVTTACRLIEQACGARDDR